MSSVTPRDFLDMMPLAILSVAGMLLILAEAFSRGRRHFLMRLTVGSCIAAVIAAIVLWKQLGEGQVGSMFGGMLVADRMGMFMAIVVSGLTALTALVSPAHQAEHEWENGEYYGLLLLAAAGMVMMSTAGDLVTVFLGLETMSIAVYVLVAARRGSRHSAEAAMKYFLMGAFATGFLLYGIALIYGATGTTDLAELRDALAGSAHPALAVIGGFMLIIAFGFKVAAVPFHMWTPDAYEGAPTPVTGYMASAVKAAAFAGLVRVFGTGLGGDLMPLGQFGWAHIFAILAAITMTVGNVAAIRQDNVKRMLAYSSISHAGVVLVGVAAMGLGGATSGAAQSAVLYYVAAYGVSTLGAFAVVSWIGSRDHERTLVDDWSGLASGHPGVALAMTVFLLSLAGMPPTGGFFGKFLVFKTAMEAADRTLVWLVIIGVLNSVISIFYYLRIVMAMYFREPGGQFRPLRSSTIVFVLVICAALVFQMGLMPSSWLTLAGG
jgi:NADH-quinone oxidoreductase subunit N